MKSVGILLLSLAVALGVKAQELTADEVVRPVTSAYTLEAGSSHLADTYLTPIKYDGWHVGFGYERMQAMKFNPEKWVMQLNFGLNLDCTENPARNATMWYFGMDLSWGMMHRWQLPYGVTLAAGGSASIDVGCIYNQRNGNNPASAKAAATVNATGYAAWNTRIGRLPITVRYQPTLPVVGAFFSPDYGQLYYEIYLGNDSGLAHCAWWGNYFNLDNRLTVDLHFGGTSLRLGYEGDFFSSKVNHLVTHIYSHSFVLGVTSEWLSVNPRKGLNPHAKMISALY